MFIFLQYTLSFAVFSYVLSILVAKVLAKIDNLWMNLLLLLLSLLPLSFFFFFLWGGGEWGEGDDTVKLSTFIMMGELAGGGDGGWNKQKENL